MSHCLVFQGAKTFYLPATKKERNPLKSRLKHNSKLLLHILMNTSCRMKKSVCPLWAFRLAYHRASSNFLIVTTSYQVISLSCQTWQCRFQPRNHFVLIIRLVDDVLKDNNNKKPPPIFLVISIALDKAAVAYASENLTISRNITNIYKDPKCSAFIIEVGISNGEGC